MLLSSAELCALAVLQGGSEQPNVFVCRDIHG